MIYDIYLYVRKKYVQLKFTAVILITNVPMYRNIIC
jgi:hypothetical protein